MGAVGKTMCRCVAVLALPIHIMATNALADTQTICRFATKCYVTINAAEDTACKSEDLLISVVETADGYLLKTPGLDFPAELSVDEANGARSYRTPMKRLATHMLTIFSDGTAAFSAHTHLTGATTISAVGTCEP